MKMTGFGTAVKILKAFGVYMLSIVLSLIFVAYIFPGDVVINPDGTETVVIDGWRNNFCTVAPIIITVVYCLRNKIRKVITRKNSLDAIPVEPILHQNHSSEEPVPSVSSVIPLPTEEPQRLLIAAWVFYDTSNISVSMLQRKFSIDYPQASQLMDRLEDLGIVSPFIGTTPRSLLKSWEECRQAIIAAHNSPTIVPPNNVSPVSLHVPEEVCGISSVEQEVLRVDLMDGHTFEYWCADVLRGNGFVNVEVTRGSGDHGVDVLAEKSGLRYAIQCKCYSHDLGNKPVQEVHAGKEIYKCHIAVVMTNRYFTPGGKQLAAATRVLLWDRDEIMRMWETANK